MRILSVVLKKMSNSINFSPEKASQRVIHNLYILSSLMLILKMLIKHSFERRGGELRDGKSNQCCGFTNSVVL